MIRYRSPYITCQGPSMRPALRDGDGLLLADCSGPADLRCGDIVVYPHPAEPCDVAHRVIRISPAGITTRGDANDRIDPGPVPRPQIRGKIVSIRRGTRSFRPASGKRGMAVHRLGLARMSARRVVTRPIRVMSAFFERRGAFHFLRPLVSLRLVAVGRAGAETFLLRRGKKTIGRKSAATGGAWDIRFPYGLILDRKKLP